MAEINTGTGTWKDRSRFDEANQGIDRGTDSYIPPSKSQNVEGTLKGLYVDSFGIYHDDLSKEMLEQLKTSRAINKELP